MWEKIMYRVSFANMKEWTPYKEVSNIDGFDMKEDLDGEVLGWLGAIYVSISKQDYKKHLEK